LRIGDYRPYGPEAALECAEVIRHRASVPAVCRDFLSYESAATQKLGQFLIRFPVRASGVEGLNALAPNEASRLRFSVQNISTRALGAQSPSERVVRVRLFARQSELGDEHVALFDEQAERVPLAQGLCREISVLGATSTRPQRIASCGRSACAGARSRSARRSTRPQGAASTPR